MEVCSVCVLYLVMYIFAPTRCVSVFGISIGSQVAAQSRHQCSEHYPGKHTHLHTKTYIHRHTCKHTCTHTYIHIYTPHAETDAIIQSQVYLRVRTWTYMQRDILVSIHARTQAHTYAGTSTHTKSCTLLVSEVQTHTHT